MLLNVQCSHVHHASQVNPTTWPIVNYSHHQLLWILYVFKPFKLGPQNNVVYILLPLGAMHLPNRYRWEPLWKYVNLIRRMVLYLELVAPFLCYSMLDSLKSYHVVNFTRLPMKLAWDLYSTIIDYRVLNPVHHTFILPHVFVSTCT